MERAVYNQEYRLYYLEPNTRVLTIFDDLFDAGTQLWGKQQEYKLNSIKIVNNELISPRDEQYEIERIRLVKEWKENQQYRLSNYTEVVAFRIYHLFRKGIHYESQHVIAIVKDYKDGVPISMRLVRDPVKPSDNRILIEVEEPDSELSKSKVSEKYDEYIRRLNYKYHVDSPMKWIKINGLKSYNGDLYDLC